MKVSKYNYDAELVRVVDGDTIICRVDLGFKVFKEIRCRLARIDAPERRTKAGKESKKFLTELMPVGSKLVISSKKYDRYGRSLAEVYLDDKNINDLLVKKKKAVYYKK